MVVENHKTDKKRRLEEVLKIWKDDFKKLEKYVVTQRYINQVKLRIYNALILTIAIHCSETWTLNVFENNCLRPLLNIKLQDYVSLSEIQKSCF